MPSFSSLIRHDGVEVDDSNELDPVQDGGVRRNNNAPQEENEEIEIALKVSELPAQTTSKLWKLKPFVTKNLAKYGVEKFFPMQCLVSYDFMHSEETRIVDGSLKQHRDICVNASTGSGPTGGGKTLVLAATITLEEVQNRNVHRWRQGEKEI